MFMRLQWAKDQQCDSILVLTNSAILITALQNKHVQDIHQERTVARIRRKGKTFYRCVVHKVGCNQVQEAHELARNAIRQDFAPVSFAREPDYFSLRLLFCVFCYRIIYPV